MIYLNQILKCAKDHFVQGMYFMLLYVDMNLNPYINKERKLQFTKVNRQKRVPTDHNNMENKINKRAGVE